MPIKLEDARVALEEADAIEVAMTIDLEARARRSHRGVLAQEHRMASGVKAVAKRLMLVRDALEEQPGGGLQEYDALAKSLAEYYTKFPDIAMQSDPLVVGQEALLACADPAALDEPAAPRGPSKQAQQMRRERRARIDEYILSHQDFSAEEHYGRFFDLHDCHLAWTNLVTDGSKDTSYLEYLSKLVDFSLVKDDKNDAYRDYLIAVVFYLEAFERRARPLAAVNLREPGLALQLASSAVELEVLGGDVLKAALEDRGLKVGGTLAQRAERLFAVKSLTVAQFPAKLRVPASASGVEKLEKRATELVTRFDDVLAATKSMVSKKLTMTYEEIAAEILEMELEAERGEESAGEDEDEEEETRRLEAEAEQDEIRKVSTGVVDPGTGQIIPKWMYKLHGLNQEFKCEICGGASYFGKRAFERHFKDFKHSNGMKALGIPNTHHFQDVTRIEDARALYQRLRVELKKNSFDPNADAEMEDSQGNVMSKRAYEDLLREGLL